MDAQLPWLLLGASCAVSALLLAAWRIAIARASARENLAVALGQGLGVVVAAVVGPRLAERLQRGAEALGESVPVVEAGVDARVSVAPPKSRKDVTP